MSEHLSHLTLDALRLGALAPDDAGSARAHLEGCAGCRTREAELARDAAGFAARFEAAALAAETLASAERTRAPFAMRWRAAIAAAVGFATAALVLVYAARAPRMGGDETRLKGGAAGVALFAAAHGGEPAPLDAGAIAAGTEIAIRLDAAPGRFVRVLYAPSIGGDAEALEPAAGAPALAPSSGARWLERTFVAEPGPPGDVVVVSCGRPFDHDEAIAEPLPAGCTRARREVRVQP